MRKTPASLRSDPRLLWPGLPGRFAPDWVADLNGIQRQDTIDNVKIRSTEISAQQFINFVKTTLALNFQIIPYQKFIKVLFRVALPKC